MDEVKQFVKQYGLPVIVKAAYGGGGRGMRKIDNESEVESHAYVLFYEHILG